MSGQVGSQIKIACGRRWLLANVRKLRVSDAEAGRVTADIDFLGEGEEEGSTGRLVNFKRGITAYPIPGSKAYPVAGHDLKQMFAADERAHIEIGTVYPTKDVRAALYVDSLLGKHFALLGSTGTGKSTSAALIMHRICDMSPEGHIVMVDPHGEYSAAFKGHGEIFNVDNLAMPYWLMNFEEHCEVFVTSQGAERQRDMDILAKCLLQARAKNRAAEGLSKLTVDSPIPYTLSDLTGAIGATADGRLSHKPELIGEALRRLEVSPRGIWMTGDRHMDVEGARHHGMDSIGVLWGFGSEEELRTAGATRLASSPADVWDALISLT